VIGEHSSRASPCEIYHNINDIVNESAAGTEVFTACKLSDCWWQILQPALVRSLLGSPIPCVSEYKVTLLWRRHVEPADMIVIVWATCQDNPLTFYLDSSLIRYVNIVICLYRIYLVYTVCSTALLQLMVNFPSWIWPSVEDQGVHVT